MALAVIGGVTLSTSLTLFVVPCAYSLFAKLERKRYASSLDSSPSEFLPEIMVPSARPAQ
jgi:hypothetical protein